MLQKLYTSAKHDILTFRKWINYSLAAVLVLFALLVGFFIATLLYDNMFEKQASIVPRQQIVYTSVAAKFPKNIQESQDIFIIYDNKIKSLEQQLADQNSLFGQQINMLNSLYSNTMTYLSMIIGLLGILMIFSGIWLTKKFDIAYNQFLDIHKKIKDSYKKLSGAEQLVSSSLGEVKVAKESVDASLKNAVDTKNEITNYVENKNDELYKRYERSRRNEIIRQIKETPDKIELFYTEMLLNIDGFRSDGARLAILPINKESDRAKLYHILILLDPYQMLREEVQIKLMIADEFFPMTDSLLQLYYSANDVYQIIKALLTYCETNINYKNEITEFIGKMLALSNGDIAESMFLRVIKDEKNKNELIDRLLKLNSSIFSQFITVRNYYLKSCRNNGLNQNTIDLLELIYSKQPHLE